MASKPSSTAPVERACDSCHRRKIKCIVEDTAPCKKCVSAGLACTCNAIPQEKGPGGSHGKVLPELPGLQRNAQSAAGFKTNLCLNEPQLSAVDAHTPGRLSPDIVQSCIEYFFTCIYPVAPVVHPSQLQQTVATIESSTESYCLIHALCAYVIIQANHKPPCHEMTHVSNVEFGHKLLDESVRTFQESICDKRLTSLTGVLVLWFYSGCYSGLAKKNVAYAYLREAITQAQLLGMNDEETYMSEDPWGIPQKRALYWLLFISEWTYALHEHRPIILRPTIHPPILGKDPADWQIAVGLNIMIKMFKIIHKTFVNFWNGVHDRDVNAASITQVQAQLSEAVLAQLACSDAQKVQICITQHWLKTRVWEISVHRGFLDSTSDDVLLTFTYPIILARDLFSRIDLSWFPSFSVHGIALIEKLFDITCCLIQIIALTQLSQDPLVLEAGHYVAKLRNLISNLHARQHRYHQLLDDISQFKPNEIHFPHHNLHQAVPASMLSLDDTSASISSLNITKDAPACSALSSPSCHPNNLLCSQTVQTGAQIPVNATQQSTTPATAINFSILPWLFA